MNPFVYLFVYNIVRILLSYSMDYGVCALILILFFLGKYRSAKLSSNKKNCNNPSLPVVESPSEEVELLRGVDCEILRKLKSGMKHFLLGLDAF